MPDALYRVLHVDPSADCATIRAAYRALAAIYHPDHAGADGEQRMRELNRAWEVLGNPERRAAYDAVRRANRPAQVPTGPAAPPWTGRAGPPPGHPSGSVLAFGIYAGWSAGAPDPHGTIVSDRSLYQPGETAQFAGVAYFDENGALVRGRSASFAITIEAPNACAVRISAPIFRGSEIWSSTSTMRSAAG